MIASRDAASSAAVPPLMPALLAMTGTQALVALALFAPGVLAPRLGLGVREIGLYGCAVFGIGMATSLWGGRLADRFGSCRVAAGCALCVAAGMVLASGGTFWGLLIAGICVGLAFGPETPASSRLLGRLAKPAQRPLIFSFRQTGNQIGAICGSLALPLIALSAPRAGYIGIAVIAGLATLLLVRLAATYDVWLRQHTPPATAPLQRASLASLDRRLRALALLSVPFSAMQLSLNAYFVTHAVEALKLPHVTAGLLLAVAQAGGLAGRLAWGAVATLTGRSAWVLAGIGLGIGALAFAIPEQGSGWSFTSLACLLGLFGLTASGWNGVFLAEVARLAPEDRVAEATGAVLTASYGGLLLAPILIMLLSPDGQMQTSYRIIGAMALLATLNLVWSNR